jgi:hypothetical protein
VNTERTAIKKEEAGIGSNGQGNKQKIVGLCNCPGSVRLFSSSRYFECNVKGFVSEEANVMERRCKLSVRWMI